MLRNLFRGFDYCYGTPILSSKGGVVYKFKILRYVIKRRPQRAPDLFDYLGTRLIDKFTFYKSFSSICL